MMNLEIGLTQEIIASCRAHGLLRNQAAYVLASCYWETARTMKPVKEAYWLKNAEKWRKKNLRYYPWYGRGLIQITWEANYLKAKSKLGVDFIKDPDLVMQDEHTVEIAVRGMKEGWFTGKKLNHYITLLRSDFVNARRIVNGTDEAEAIAEIAEDYDKALEDMGYGVVNPKPLPKSRTVKGGSLATTGGVVVMVEPVKEMIDVIVGQEAAFSSGNIVQLIIGGIIVVGGLFTLYARWDDAGRPVFWK